MNTIIDFEVEFQVNDEFVPVLLEIEGRVSIKTEDIEVFRFEAKNYTRYESLIIEAGKQFKQSDFEPKVIESMKDNLWIAAIENQEQDYNDDEDY